MTQKAQTAAKEYVQKTYKTDKGIFIKEIFDAYVAAHEQLESELYELQQASQLSKEVAELREENQALHKLIGKQRTQALKLADEVQELFDMRKVKGSTATMKNQWNVLANVLYDTRKLLTGNGFNPIASKALNKER
jgi:hydrogenase maturation factor HypF (carbamoyltransferase family)